MKSSKGACRTPVLSANDVWFSYDDRTPVLRGVSATVRRGEVAMLLGRSGCGKTTLLKIMQGILRPQNGELTSADSPHRNGVQCRPALAYIPQSLGLVRGLTALDNVLTGALGRTGTWRSLFKAFPKETVDEAKGLLLRMGLADKAESPARNLSGGERQRVAIARALMARPQLILADELVSQLDPVTSHEILGMIRALAGQGLGFIVTTHDADTAAEYADRVIVMREGRVVRDAEASTLTAEGIVELLR